MRWIRIIFLLLLTVSTLHRAGAREHDSLKKEILELVNQHRAKLNMAPLELVNVVNSAAEKHSEDMAVRRVPFGHEGFDARIDGLLANIKGANAAAENVAYGPATAEAVVHMWLNSQGHKKNIEGNFNLTGIGVAMDKSGRPYYTQIFINRK